LFYLTNEKEVTIMSQIPENLHYTKSHEWVRKESDGTCTVGITDHAQSMLGDFVFVDLPEVDAEYKAEADCCVAESVKAASDIYMPISGTVTAVNDKLETSPGLVNSDPYGEGWLFQFKPDTEKDLDGLLDAQAYEEVEKTEDH